MEENLQHSLRSDVDEWARTGLDMHGTNGRGTIGSKLISLGHTGPEVTAFIRSDRALSEAERAVHLAEVTLTIARKHRDVAQDVYDQTRRSARKVVRAAVGYDDGR